MSDVHIDILINLSIANKRKIFALIILRKKYLVLRTCSSKTSVAVDGQLPLLDSKRHDLDHVQDCHQGRHTVILPAKVVVIN